MRDQSHQFAQHILKESTKASSDPIYSGDHFKDVAEYLNRSSVSPSQAGRYVPQNPIIHLYNFDLGPGDVQQFRSVSDFEAECEKHGGARWHRAGLLFLTGHCTPETLCAVGGVFGIEPLHLIEHFDFRPTVKFPTYTFPTLPSASTSVLKLTIPTVGHIVSPRTTIFSSKKLPELRQLCSERVKQQSRTLDNHAAGGEAELRRFYLLDAETFSIEQEITISLTDNGTDWTLLALCDNSGDGSAPKLPWQDDEDIPELSNAEVHLIPVTQMNRRRHAGGNQSPVSSAREENPQTLALLPANYGRMLVGDLAMRDPFYALYELLDFFAAAECQFINVMDHHITRQINLAGQDGDNAPSLSDFQYIFEILETHRRRLQRLVSTLSKRDSLSWPQPEDKEVLEATSANMSKLIDDFRYLDDRVEWLLTRAERGKDIVIGNTSTLIATRSYNYNFQIGQLTKIGQWIAILYVPWSLITGIFGMNFREFGQGDLSIYVWGAASAVVLSISLTIAGLLAWRWNSDESKKL